MDVFRKPVVHTKKGSVFSAPFLKETKGKKTLRFTVLFWSPQAFLNTLNMYMHVVWVVIEELRKDSHNLRNLEHVMGNLARITIKTI